MPAQARPPMPDLTDEEPTTSVPPPFSHVPDMDWPPVEEPVNLTVEVRRQIQEILRDANLVSRPERALIAKFVAGVRHNPCPSNGNLASIKLSSHLRNYKKEENVKIYMVEVEHFHMNYLTGQWRCVKKHRRVQ